MYSYKTQHMTNEILYKKTYRYLAGAAMPAETKQIQNWLSCIDKENPNVSDAEKERIELEILNEVKAYTAYPLFYPTEVPWWKKITAFF